MYGDIHDGSKGRYNVRLQHAVRYPFPEYYYPLRASLHRHSAFATEVLIANFQTRLSALIANPLITYPETI